MAANRASGVTRAADLVVTPGPYGKRPFILCEDPQEIGRNITASAYRFKEVRALFRAANEAIAAGGDLTFLPEMAGGPRAPPRRRRRLRRTRRLRRGEGGQPRGDRAALARAGGGPKRKRKWGAAAAQDAVDAGGGRGRGGEAREESREESREEERFLSRGEEQERGSEDRRYERGYARQRKVPGEGQGGRRARRRRTGVEHRRLTRLTDVSRRCRGKLSLDAFHETRRESFRRYECLSYEYLRHLLLIHR